jgi:hypothetical protein
MRIPGTQRKTRRKCGDSRESVAPGFWARADAGLENSGLTTTIMVGTVKDKLDRIVCMAPNETTDNTATGSREQDVEAQETIKRFAHLLRRLAQPLNLFPSPPCAS